MKRPLMAGPGPTMATMSYWMPPRCLDVWCRFCRWLKTPLLSQQRSQSCIFRGAGALAEIVHGDLSTRATAQKCLLSHFLRLNNVFSPLVQLVGCQLSIIYCGVGGGHSKYSPDHTITNSGRCWIYCTQRNTIQCFPDSATVDCVPKFYYPRPNKIKEMGGHVLPCFAHFFPFYSLLVLFQKFNQS